MLVPLSLRPGRKGANRCCGCDGYRPDALVVWGRAKLPAVSPISFAALWSSFYGAQSTLIQALCDSQIKIDQPQILWLQRSLMQRR